MKPHELPEPAVVYEAGERRTHAEHAAEAYDLAGRSDALRETSRRGASQHVLALAQWHAMMATYELLALSTRVIA